MAQSWGLFATLWAVARQAPLSMGCPRQEYCNGLPCPHPGDLPNSGWELVPLALQADSFISRLKKKRKKEKGSWRKPIVVNFHMYISVSNVYFLLLQNNTDAGKTCSIEFHRSKSCWNKSYPICVSVCVCVCVCLCVCVCIYINIYTLLLGRTESYVVKETFLLWLLLSDQDSES